MKFSRFHALTLGAALLASNTGCQPPAAEKQISIDGSSTVYPVSEAVAEEFSAKNPGVKVAVGFSGTGGGMKKFAAGEIDICDASRGMKEAEAEKCKAAGIEFIELSVAYDGLAVVIHPKNDSVDSLTVEELKQIWQPENPAKKWSDVNPDWPEEDLVLYGPGTDSGTFDYFTEEIVGETKASRSDYGASEDDNTIVNGVAGNEHALGYFGFAYYLENQDKLKLVAVDGGDGPVKPSMETVMDGTYSPLARPLYIYVNLESLKRPEVAEFVKFYMAQAAALSKEVGYVPVPEDVAQENETTLNAALSPAETPAEAPAEAAAE
ncbi:Phosphate-binding protein PstS precursor [Posidoniimonas polymericola]|uniref:Phosphate-binding protein n=1 Tax=Posidoniimonas polymericola TaxID=2528002 RepID=A0A5C5YRP4_9BACT|nr:PstS family phosphate ABC transporter substrate-binding protein [Posidoniimonas polymericola]TWT77621.1 Phosphate-binding protein PstS precursor [Posidoniimonas polymericola]